ncbi:MAG: hypothetical protein GX335_06985 [Firmicutes bacterium]|nr:hypothetical protein [Bacillota bacterium]
MRKLVFLGLFTLALIALSGICHSSGLVIFEIEVISGFTVSNPENLVFDAVAPGQTSNRDLTVKVWSNIEWDLLVSFVEKGESEDLSGEVEFSKNGGIWQRLTNMGLPAVTNQLPTGAAGREVVLPFRFTSSYDDALGSHSLQVELTVAPAI